MATSAWRKGRGFLRSLWTGADGSATAASSKPSDDLARWKALKADAKGMLHPKVYRELYLLARDLPDQDIVEIGGAAGAGSIALALGIKESGKQSRVIVAEKLEGGSRLDFGDRAENQRIIEDNFRKFGVLDQIRLFPHEVTLENGGEVAALVRSGTISALIHDADGRVDRDFFLFWPLLRDGGAIVIDDYADTPEKFRPVTPRHPAGGIKAVVTYRLTNLMIEWGLLRSNQVIGNTLFGVKPAAADFSRLDLLACKRAIAEVERERDAVLASRAGT